MLDDTTVTNVTPGAPEAFELSRASRRIWTGYEVMVTPVMARSWLLSNEENRQQRKGHVNSLKGIMGRGEWRPTHQGIAFADNGRLIDGQHRLEAIVSSGLSVPLVVFVNCSLDTFGALDKSLKRTLKDDLMKDARTAAILTFYMAIFDMAAGVSHKSASPNEASSLFKVLEPSLTAISNICPTAAARRTSAGIRGTVTLLHAMSDEGGREYLCNQWAAWVSLSVGDMSKSVGALLPRLENSNKAGGSRRWDETAAAWRAFSPKSPDLTKIMVKDFRVAVAEMDLELRKLWPTAPVRKREI